MSCKVLNREAKQHQQQRCTRRFREQVLTSGTDGKSQKENKRTKWEDPQKDDPAAAETQNEGHVNDDDDNNDRSIEGVGIKMLRESSCLLPPSQPVLLRSGKMDDISRETMVTPNRTSTRQDGGIRKTMSRSGQRKCRSASSNTDQSSTLKKSGETGSECGSEQQKEVTSESEVITLDIFDDSFWDTDLEAEDTKEPYDHSGRSSYITRCRQLGVTPISYFLRHMQDKDLDLRYHGLGSRGARAVTPTIATSCHIQKLDLTDNNLSRSGGLALCEMIKENCFISELDSAKATERRILQDPANRATSTQPQKEIGREDQHSLEKKPHRPSLAHSTSRRHNVDDKHKSLNGQRTLKGVKRHKRRKPLNKMFKVLSSNKLHLCARDLCDAIAQNDTLTHLTLSDNDFSDYSAPVLAKLIMNAKKLEYLDLSHNKFESRSGKALGPALAENTTITHLNLSWNNLRSTGFEALAIGIKGNCALKRLDLSWNGIDRGVAKALGEALKCNNTLEHLDIRVNPECSVLIGLGLSSNEALKELKMVRNPLESAGCYAICAAVLRNPNPVVEKLDFQHSHVNDDFNEVFDQLKEKLPDVKVIHGSQEAKKKPKAMIHPMALLVRYLDDNNIRLADCFGKFDEDGSMTVTHEEFIKGIESIGLRLDDAQKTFLLNEMDRDGDGEIDYSELVRSRMEFKAKANSAEYLFPKMIQPTS